MDARAAVLESYDRWLGERRRAALIQRSLGQLDVAGKLEEAAVALDRALQAEDTDPVPTEPETRSDP